MISAQRVCRREKRLSVLKNGDSFMIDTGPQLHLAVEILVESIAHGSWV